MLIVRRAFRHLSRVCDVLVRRTRLEREITIYPDDVFLTSYPRSGNTWTRFLIGNLIHQNETVTFLNVERLVPDMYKTADWVLRRLPRPRILKSHECFDPRYPKVIYIVRDPRDVAVSNYHWEMKLRSIREGYPMEEFVPRWMKPEFWPRIGSWADHARSWIGARQGGEGFLLLRYEDLQEDPHRELAKVAGFLGLTTDRERIKPAVDLSSADHMRKLERKQGTRWVATSYTRADKPFVRGATSGGWRSNLPPQTVAYMEARWGDLMRSLGYELASQTSSDAALWAAEVK